ncbi:MAG TPA: hybrid sensor histidine kinase/response regulator [Anaeromyxobacter sp.]
MTYAASIALMSAGIACYVAALSVQFARAPGWRDQRYFSLAAIAAAAFAALNVPTVAPVLSDRAVVFSTRIQFVLVALHVFAWLRYSSIVVGRAASRVDRYLVWILAAIAAGAALPDAYFTGGIRVDSIASIGYSYRSPVATPLGDAAYVVAFSFVLVPTARFARAWRRGLPNAGVQFLALVFLLVLGVNDLLVMSDVYQGPYLSDIAFLLPIAAVGYVLTKRFVEDSRAHQALRRDLEHQVAERTAELGQAQAALHRAEKLAALGQFAAGVAHEVNNPACVVSANLSYIDQMESDVLTSDGRDALKESIQSMQRIAAIVRQLLDAGRLAASPQERKPIALRPLADGAISAVRARFGKRVRLTNVIGESVHAFGHEGVLAQVVVNLVANAVQAIPDHRSDGNVSIRSETTAGHVTLVVEDDGAGMEPEVLRRVFEPFFTTKPFGSGTGLGLAVSRGLVMSLDGDLRLESSPGVGTRAYVDLALAARPTPVPARREARRAAEQGRILIVDDEAAVLTSIRRLLEPQYRIALATGVDEGLSHLDQATFDLVLCDVMMPGGGAERLYRTLLGRAPAVARRVVFFTGGAVTDEAREFLGSQPQPVLFKPLDLEQFARVAEQMCRGSRGGGQAENH